MRRREFIALLGGAAAAWPLAARAQWKEPVRRIGVMMSIADDAEGQRRLRALQEGLAKLGWSDGKNIRLDVYWSVSDAERARAVAKELIGRAPDLILASGTVATAASHQATAAIPIVFTVVSEPVQQGLVESLARPAGNITGFSNLEPSLGGKWVELLKTIAPNVTGVLVMFNLQTAPATLVRSHSADAAAEKLAIELIRTPVRKRADIEAAIRMLRSPAHGLIILPDTFLNDHRQMILDLAAQHGIPTMCPFRYLAAEGGLISYGIDLADTFRQAASYVDRILRGDKPADLPVQQPTKFELAINLKTAKALGLSVPPTLLALADEVIE
jgi:putative ABC transport system substrate-binding protein